MDFEGRDGPSDFAPYLAVWTPWLAQALAGGRYLGLVGRDGGHVVAGAGILLRPRMPTPDDTSPQEAHILNVYTLPNYRAQSIGTALMQAALAAAQAKKVRALSLNASPAGRPVYERFGFILVENLEMRLVLPIQTHF